ncbi:hypothetical protein ACIG0C_09650 [Kitasatospora aureofaciens]|uniref:Uncharacterized protein n=1 Tax=Kitasatospora aureofaciens TaxID=1894 RepID=A0A1E7MXG4_KITAU|nr:hypothetical protein [Kitasatospora aureofaciens]OEV33101.1 hypothetical protein HS99_0014690 [Kitasatospora aureofaciens]UKZ09331.1 hypothetical protein BOQ63_035990 [Streptomyces viridifaciens]GGU56071.1 hypothetical protein GCM10010502_02960 [Kitasatospora aureofaciens]
MSDQEKGIAFLALRHQLLVLQLQVGTPSFTDTDRATLTGPLHRLPRDRLCQLLTLVRPDTILRRDRNLPKRRHTATCAPKRRGRPPTLRSIRALGPMRNRSDTGPGSQESAPLTDMATAAGA